MPEFSLRRFQEFSPCWDVIKNIFYANCRSDAVLRRWRDFVVFAVDLPSGLAFFMQGSQSQTAHGSDGSQRLAAESKSIDGFQILQGYDFGSGVTCQSQD